MERVLDHAGGDPNSHLFKHSVESGHPVLDMNNYKIGEEGYKNNAIKRKIVEALLIKEIKPTLNKQHNSVELKLQLMAVLTLGVLIINICLYI